MADKKLSPEVPPKPEKEAEQPQSVGGGTKDQVAAEGVPEPQKICKAKLRFADGEEASEGEEETIDDFLDPCLEYGDLDEEEEDEEEEEEQTLELDKRLSTVLPPKSFRRHNFIKHEICIPDKDHKVPPVPKGKPWYLVKKSNLEKRRQDSSIALIMPKQEDPEVIALRRTNKMVQKLMKYMKKSWKVRINHKQEERELEHRTLASVYTRKPEDWMELIKARETKALETGFFSPMDIPYQVLIDPLELDTPLLTLHNLPPDLKITAARWIQSRLQKEELKRKRDAFLPRIPHTEIKRPNRGRSLNNSEDIATFPSVFKKRPKKDPLEEDNIVAIFGVIREGFFDYNKNRPETKNTERTIKIAEDVASSTKTNKRAVVMDPKKMFRFRI